MRNDFRNQNGRKWIFTLNHYAGDVTYESENFIEKNKDYAILEHTEVLSTSETNILRLIFEEKENEILDEGTKTAAAAHKKICNEIYFYWKLVQTPTQRADEKITRDRTSFCSVKKPNQKSVTEHR